MGLAVMAPPVSLTSIKMLLILPLLVSAVCGHQESPQFVLRQAVQMKLQTATAGLAGMAAAQSSGLVPLTFTPLPLGSITPNGWLRNELNNQAQGLAGHEYEFYDYVHRSSWLGGTQEYSGLNEGFPYWFNGLVPLAYALNDATLKAQVHAAADYVISHQQSDGWIGPEATGHRTFWGRYPVLLGMIGLAEANSTWTTRVQDSMHKFFSLMNSMLKANGTGYVVQPGDSLSSGDFDWGRVRSQDMVISLMWLLEKDPRNDATILNDNIKMLYDKAWKWEAWYNNAVYPKQDLYTLPDSVTNNNYHFLHGVNVAQGLKATAVYRRYSHNDSLLQTTRDGVNWTYTYHGSPAGTVIADEREDGVAPYQGAELCTAVEAMYSLSYLYQALGDNGFADMCERAAFNALPAHVTPDWWAHQYMEQANQPYSKNLGTSPFYNSNELSQTFGLEPNYPCCTVNHPQGFPKFLSAAYVTVGSNSLAHALLGPAVVQTALNGNNIKVDCQTNYPFADSLNYTVQADKAFDFYVRVPAWAISANPTVTVGGNKISFSPNATTGLGKISLPAGQSTVVYSFQPKVQVSTRANDAVSIYRGSLLYALQIGASVTSTGPHSYTNRTLYPSSYAPAQSRDYTMTNTTAWAVAIDPSTLKFNGTTPATLANPIFSPGAAPMSLTVKACEIAWPLYKSSTPGNPPAKSQRKCLGSTFTATLIPFGGAKLHMAELPTMTLS